MAYRQRITIQNGSKGVRNVLAPVQWSDEGEDINDRVPNANPLLHQGEQQGDHTRCKAAVEVGI